MLVLPRSKSPVPPNPLPRHLQVRIYAKYGEQGTTTYEVEIDPLLWDGCLLVKVVAENDQYEPVNSEKTKSPLSTAVEMDVDEIMESQIPPYMKRIPTQTMTGGPDERHTLQLDAILVTHDTDGTMLEAVELLLRRRYKKIVQCKIRMLINTPGEEVELKAVDALNRCLRGRVTAKAFIKSFNNVLLANESCWQNRYKTKQYKEYELYLAPISVKTYFNMENKMKFIYPTLFRPEQQRLTRNTPETPRTRTDLGDQVRTHSSTVLAFQSTNGQSSSKIKPTKRSLASENISTETSTKRLVRRVETRKVAAQTVEVRRVETEEVATEAVEVPQVQTGELAPEAVEVPQVQTGEAAAEAVEIPRIETGEMATQVPRVETGEMATQADRRVETSEMAIQAVEVRQTEEVAIQAEGENDNDCKVCYENEIDTVILRCGHLCLCNTCAQNVLRERRECPICRMRIVEVIRVYRS